MTDTRQSPVFHFGHEVLWRGDPDGHLFVSIHFGTIFGMTNQVAQEAVHELFLKDGTQPICLCEQDEVSGNICVRSHVDPIHWIDYAHAMLRSAYLYCAMHPELWNKRGGIPQAHLSDDGNAIQTSHRSIN